VSTIVPLESTHRIKVLEVVGNAIVGGMETCVRRLVPHLFASGFDVTCLAPFESAFTESLRDIGCAVYVTPMQQPIAWDAVQFAQSLVRALGIDVMHSHLENAHALAALTGALTGVRTFASVHGRQLTLLDCEAYRLGWSQLGMVCQHTYLQALNLGVAPGDAHLIPNGLDIEAFDASRTGFSLRRELGLAADGELVGFVGRLSPEKNPALFVQMASHVHGERPDVHFVLVGDGPLAPELRALAHALGLEHCLHFAGVRQDMRSVYGELDVMAMTSDSEAMPLALIEAMACGVAVVASQVGGVPELVRAGQTGLLAPPGDARAFANAVLGLLQEPGRRASIGGVAREWIAARFTHAATVERTAECLTRVARARSRATDPMRSSLRGASRRPLATPSRGEP